MSLKQGGRLCLLRKVKYCVMKERWNTVSFKKGRILCY